MNLSNVGAAFCLACAAVGTWISNLYGGWNAALAVLLWLVIGDYVTGLLASILDGSGLSSKTGFRGIARKVMILFLVLVAHQVDVALAINFIMNMIIYFYVTNESISLLENVGRMGVPIPKQIVQMIDVLKGRAK